MEKKEVTVEEQFAEKVNELGLMKDKLAKAGFSGVVDRMSQVDRVKKAYANYKVITKEQISAHNKVLREATEVETGFSRNYKKAELIDLAEYMETPPIDCLEDIIKARDTQIFDNFKLMRVVWTEEKKKVKDPIVFGTIDGIADEYFFITQWDDDISLEQLLD